MRDAVAHRGYVGLRPRDRVISASGVAAVGVAMAMLLLFIDTRTASEPDVAERILHTFHLPLPPPPTPPPPLMEPPPVSPSDRVARPNTPPRAGLIGGGTPGTAAATPMPLDIDTRPPVLAAPPSPVFQLDAAPPSAGQVVGMDLGGSGRPRHRHRGRDGIRQRGR